MEQRELQALISLLDDSDEIVFREVSNKLFDIGLEAVSELENAWENTLSELLQQRIENLIQSIQFNNVKENLKRWSASEEQDLLEGAFWIAKYQYPDINFDTIKKKVDVIKQDIWLEIHDNLTALEKVKILNHIIYEVHGFSRNMSNFYSPQNSYINYVLEEKKGNSLSLAILYAYIAQRLDLPIYGVNLPKNFILAYKDEISSFATYSETDPNNILFYINPFNKGAVFGKREIDFFIKQQNLEHKDEYFVPCSNSLIIRELIENLILAYEKLGYPDKIYDLNILLDLL